MQTERNYQMDVLGYNKATLEKFLGLEQMYSHYNTQFIMDKVKAGLAEGLRFAPHVQSRPVIITGSGTGLDKAGPMLKDWKHDVITATSQASTAVYYGKNPKYVCCIDPACPKEHFTQVDTWAGRDTALVTHPGMAPEFLHAWPNKIYLYRKQESTNYYDEAQKWGYSRRLFNPNGDLRMIQVLIPDQIISLASVLPVQICVAHILGYSPIYLVGCEHAAGRFDTWLYENGEWVSRHGPKSSSEFHGNDKMHESARAVMASNGTISVGLFLFYKLCVIEAWRFLMAQIIDTSDENTALQEFPKAKIEDVIAQQGELGGNIVPFTMDQIIDASELYLAEHNMWAIYSDSGINITIFQDPLKEIPERLKAELASGTKLDFDANMKRVNALYERVQQTSTERSGVVG